MKLEIDLDNLTAEEQEIAKRLAEKKKELYWTPKIDEHYWYLRDIGDVFITENNETEVDESRISTGNCFKTEKQAREAFVRMKMLTKWKQLSLEAGEAKNPWGGNSRHYFLYWDYSKEKFDYNYYQTHYDGNTFFPSEESLKVAINELGEENVKKYILGVKE